MFTNNILLFDELTPREMALSLAAKVKKRRLEMGLTQIGLSKRAGLKFSTFRRFEQTGEISLQNFLQIAFALNAISDFEALFNQRQYQTLDELLASENSTRKRGKKNE